MREAGSAGRRKPRGVAIALGDGSLALEGLYLPGAAPGGAAIAPPHPLMGGSMDSPVVSELAYACQESALASLAFNWRGVGASGGEPSGESAAADQDYAAALAHLEDTVEGPLTACGYSFGAAAAVRAARGRERVRRLLLVAPPLALLGAGALASFDGPLLVIAGAEDAFVRVSALEKEVEAARRGELAVIPAADHFFAAGLAHLHRAAADWLARTQLSALGR